MKPNRLLTLTETPKTKKHTTISATYQELILNIVLKDECHLLPYGLNELVFNKIVP